jgi:hypothetical protein
MTISPGTAGSREPRLFNTPFEAGIRSVVLLDAVSPACLTLDRLVALDHLVVHTADIGGPDSLHPPERTRAAEMLVRRELLERGLGMMMGRGLVDRRLSSAGISYCAGDEAAIFVHLLRARYSQSLKDRAKWLRQVAALPDEEFGQVVKDQIELWALQFQSSAEPGESAS